MFTRSLRCCAVSAALVSASVGAASQVLEHYGFGTPASQDELSKFFAIQPDGRGLPAGRGSAAKGAKIYAERCATCHGDHLEGNPQKGVGGDKLIGGRGTLTTKAPIKTVESYWPYATTLFDYVKRAMPMNAPGSLADDEVYGLVAYILSEAKIIQPEETMDASILPKVMMPNREGFEPDPRPEVQLYRPATAQ
jgi:cytochrome c5